VKQNALLFSSDRLISMLKPPFRFYHFGSTYLNLESAKKVTSARKYSRSDGSTPQQDPSLAFRIIERMSRRIRDLNAEIVRLKTGD